MTLLERQAPPDPFVLFKKWFREAADSGAPQPDAMTLATASSDGTPSARMVLFKGLDDERFYFYSNYGSQKGHDLAENSRAALVFFWIQTRHQVRVSGTVRRVSPAASAEYFDSRPRGAQLSALASRQSRVVRSREVLEKSVVNLAKQYPLVVPLPADWGGYALRPRWIEFWESRENRLHDRLRYRRRRPAGWRLERLAP